MRKYIKTPLFSEQGKAYIQELKTAQKQAKINKKEAKEALKKASDDISKDDFKGLKIIFLQAKIQYKAEKAAWKAARKILVPYLLEEALEEVVKTNKKAQNKKDADCKPSSPHKGKRKNAPKIVLKRYAPSVEEEKPAVAEEEKADKLILIEGIGPKIAKVLNENGIYTFKQLATFSADAVKAILLKNNLKLADPTTWGTQAGLAADGKMEAFEALKKELKHGKKLSE